MPDCIALVQPCARPSVPADVAAGETPRPGEAGWLRPKTMADVLAPAFHVGDVGMGDRQGLGELVSRQVCSHLRGRRLCACAPAGCAVHGLGRPRIQFNVLGSDNPSKMTFVGINDSPLSDAWPFSTHVSKERHLTRQGCSRAFHAAGMPAKEFWFAQPTNCPPVVGQAGITIVVNVVETMQVPDILQKIHDQDVKERIDFLKNDILETETRLEHMKQHCQKLEKSLGDANKKRKTPPGVEPAADSDIQN